MNADNLPKTLADAVKYFADDENAHTFLCALRWPDGNVRCHHCDSLNVGTLSVSRRIVPSKIVRGKVKPARTLTRRLWNCKNCRKQFTAIRGTIFESSPLGLDKWFSCVWLLVNAKNGVSSYEIARSLGVTQKSAWFMLQRLRFLLHDGGMDKLAGELEADECFIGFFPQMQLDALHKKVTLS